MELHVALHLFPPAGQAEEEPQGNDTHVEGTGGYSVLGHLQLV